MKTYRLIVLDVDGTLVKPKSGATFRKSADDWQWLPGRLERCQELHSQGVKLALATNQGGVAFGHLDAFEIEQETRIIASAIGAVYAGICFSHPHATIEQYRRETDARKPGPGMLIAAMAATGIGPQETLMVGDRGEDEQAAINAGIDFMRADSFFAS